MKASIVEMEGLLRGKCVPAKMLVNESLAEYLVRQFDSLHERAEVAERERDELRLEIARIGGAKAIDVLRRDVAAGGPVDNPVLGYADSYRGMASRGVENVPIWGVISILERFIAPLCTTPPASSVPDRNQLRELVDMVWNEATESETVPSTADADRIIDKVFHGIVQEHASSRYQSAAPAASAHDGWKLVPVEPTAKMMVAGTLVSEFQEDPAGMYRAMIAAAPSPGGDGG